MMHFQSMTEWFAAMAGVYAALPVTRRTELEIWEHDHLDGETGTSDWPGWVEYIGSPPLIIRPKPVERRPIPVATRVRIMVRDESRCVQCGSVSDLTIDHRIAVVNGGMDDDANLQVMCRSCNCSKGAR
jgi:hypothetical protein